MCTSTFDVFLVMCFTFLHAVFSLMCYSLITARRRQETSLCSKTINVPNCQSKVPGLDNHVFKHDVFKDYVWSVTWWSPIMCSTNMCFIMACSAQDGQITPPQSYDQLGLDERRYGSTCQI